MKPPLLTAAAVAQRIGCRPQAVRRLMTQGRMPGAKVAGQWRVDEGLLETWLADQQRPRPAARVVPSELPPLHDNPFL